MSEHFVGGEVELLMKPFLQNEDNRPKPYKRWQSAYVSIRCSRVFLSLPSSGTVSQATLTHLMKKKNVETLQNLGGVHGVASALKTSVDYGVSAVEDDSSDVEGRQKTFGSNTYQTRPSKGFFHFVERAFLDPIILIFLACAALSLGFEIKRYGVKKGFYDGGTIFVAVSFIIAACSVNNFRQNRLLDKLSQDSNNIVQVEAIRSGRRQQVLIYDIVVGDVVVLKIGDQVPADGLFLEGYSLLVDESLTSGESHHVEINGDKNPFLFSGTKVANGFAKMLVTSVGMNTTRGQMMSPISGENDEETPLQSRLRKLTSTIGKAGLFVNVLLVLYFTGNTKDENGNKEFHGIVNGVVGIVAASIAIVAVAIPEGLPLAVTSTLAYSMKMMAGMAIVRKLSACETMGSVTTICIDKTGTLTLNQMKVTNFWLGQEPIKGKAHESLMHSKVLQLIQEGVALNTIGSVYKFKSTDSEYEFTSNPIEKAIISWDVLDLAMNMEELTQNCTILHAKTFNSKKKRSHVVIRRKADNKIHAHWKGAAEIVLKFCSKYYDASDNIKDLDSDKKMEFEQIIQGMAASSLICIAFAHLEVTKEDEQGSQKVKEEGLTLLGLVGIKDSCHHGVYKDIQDCQQAGVNVKMITGDNIFTAIAIERVDKICVMAQSSPKDKLLMVQCLKQKGHVVAIIGDDANDAMSLKKADIGLCKKIQGSEVAKESSDIIILNDSFSSVVTVLKWGRCVYHNIQKFIQFQLTVNIVALTINFLVAASTNKVALATVQLLWVNFITDTLGSLTLATEKPTIELLNKPPKGKTEPLIDIIMWRNLLAQALYQITILLTLQFMGEALFGVSSKVNDTLFFNTFVLCQVFNEFNARKLEEKNVFKGIHRNKLFLGMIGITIVLQVLMVEFLKKFANTERLNWEQWGACILMAAISWPIGWAVKFIHIPERPLLSFLNMKRQ
ncbi:putative calcium-transporting ATPase 13, plasma membrane-type [Prosopis cineraria]|uniref:putative calcium-transporting ATPase 13, plasma membrane-type n=1 Tax=Prosopis cineraria TaxID=364024 RepID=UPI00240FB1A8|nr:putative calcium-transporting ATPase 13, plasma membrane-type [Prosopis cineraria]